MLEYRNLTPMLKRSLIIGGLALVAVVATIALTRKTEPAATATAANSVLAGDPEPVSRDTGYLTPGSPVVSAVSPFGTSEPAPVRAAAEPAPVTQQFVPEYQAPVVETAVRRRSRRVVTRRYYYRSTVRRRRGRPFSHSVAIVGGSAAGGALIGGLAGGGKGAAIGALAGGAGGLVYDRATHKHPR